MSKIESGKLSLNMDLLSPGETMDSITNTVQPQIKSEETEFRYIYWNNPDWSMSIVTGCGSTRYFEPAGPTRSNLLQRVEQLR